MFVIFIRKCVNLKIIISQFFHFGKPFCDKLNNTRYIYNTIFMYITLFIGSFCNLNKRFNTLNQ